MKPARERVNAADIHWSWSVVAFSLADRVGRAVIRIVMSRPRTRKLTVIAANPSHLPGCRVCAVIFHHLPQISRLRISGVTLIIKRLALVVVIVLLGAACTGAPTSAAPHPPRNVFLIVMENHSPDEVLDSPFTASLAARYGVAASYHAITHPSVPNYLALTSGQTWGVRD